MIRSAIIRTIGILLCGSLASVQQCNGHAQYTLKPTPKAAAWGYYDAKAALVLDIKPELGGLCPAKCDIL
jgi:hypothetical protein